VVPIDFVTLLCWPIYLCLKKSNHWTSPGMLFDTSLYLNAVLCRSVYNFSGVSLLVGC